MQGNSSYPSAAGGTQLVSDDKTPHPLDLNKQMANPPIVVAEAVPVNDVQQVQVEVIPPEVEYRDVPYAIGFVVHLIVVAAIGFGLGVPAVNELGSNSTSTAADMSNSTSSSDRPLGAPIATAAIVAFLLSAAALGLIRTYPVQVLKCMLITEAALVLLIAVVTLASGYMFMAGVYFIIAAIFVCYYFAVRRRLPFTGVMLELAITSTEQHKGVFCVAFSSPVAQVVWYVVWLLSLFGILKATSNSYFIVIVWVFFFYWAAEVMRNVGHTTTSGTVGAWWFSKNPTNPVMSSLKRALTTSLGSIAKGSAIVAALKTIRFVLRAMERAARKDGNMVLVCLLCCIECIVRQIEAWIRYFNTYAYIIVSLYGSSFTEASSEVFHMFQHRGWDAIINDDLVGTVVIITSLTVGCLTGLCGAGVAAAQMHNGSVNLGWVTGVGFLSFWIGLIIAFTVLDVISIAVKTLYVCYAKAPLALSTTHPTAFSRLNDTWRQFYPDVYNSSGYHQLEQHNQRGGQHTPVAQAYPVAQQV